MPKYTESTAFENVDEAIAALEHTDDPRDRALLIRAAMRLIGLSMKLATERLNALARAAA